MIDLTGYEDVSPALPGEFAKLPAGGYICHVVNAQITNSKAGNPMLVLFLDIAEGEFKNHFRNAFDRVKNFRSDIKWDNSAIYRQLIFDKTSGRVSSFFKGLLASFELSNPNFKVNPRSFDENILRGLLIGFIFANEEYKKSDGSIASRIFPKFPKSTYDIRENNFVVPELKKIPETVSKPDNDDYFAGTPIDPNDTPF